MNLADSPDHVLAHGIRQIDQLLATLLHNAATRRAGKVKAARNGCCSGSSPARNLTI